MTSHNIDLTRWAVDERRTTAAQLTRAGMSSTDIAVRLGLCQRTVFRYRREMRERQAA